MATIPDRLAEAESAYHDLMTGKAVVEVTDQNGEKVTFHRASASKLAQYIQSLKMQMKSGNRGPMRVYF